MLAAAWLLLQTDVIEWNRRSHKAPPIEPAREYAVIDFIIQRMRHYGLENFGMTGHQE